MQTTLYTLLLSKGVNMRRGLKDLVGHTDATEHHLIGSPERPMRVNLRARRRE
jgi:hypothetical protein